MPDTVVNVVIADRRSTSRALLRELMDQWGWNVVGEAVDAVQALSVVRSTSPDLLIADASLPDMTPSQLSELVGPPGGPVVLGLLDFPHQHSAANLVAVVKGVPLDHLKKVIMRALAEAFPNDPRWAASIGHVDPRVGPDPPASAAPPPPPPLPPAPASPAPIPSASSPPAWRVIDLGAPVAEPEPAVVLDLQESSLSAVAEPEPAAAEAPAVVEPGAVEPPAVEIPGGVEASAEAVEPPAVEPPAEAGVPAAEPTAGAEPAPAADGRPDQPEIFIERRRGGGIASQSFLSALLGDEDEPNRGRRGGDAPDRTGPVTRARPDADLPSYADDGYIDPWRRADAPPVPDLAHTRLPPPPRPPAAPASPRDRTERLARMALGAPDAEDMVVAAQAIEDPSPEVRAMALRAMGRAPELASPDALERFAVDPEADIRRQALALLGATGHTREIPFLVDRLGAELEADVRAAASEALASLAGPGGTDPGAARALLSAVARLPEPGDTYDPDLVRLARAVGSDVLLRSMSDADGSVARGANFLVNASMLVEPHPSAAAAGGLLGAERPGTHHHEAAAAAIAPAASVGAGRTDLSVRADLTAGVPAGVGPDGPGTGTGGPGPGTGLVPDRSGDHWNDPADTPVAPPLPPVTPPVSSLPRVDLASLSADMDDAVDDLALPTLLEASGDPDENVRRAATDTLRLMAPRRVVAWVASRLAEGHTSALAQLESLSQVVDLAPATESLAELSLTLSDTDAGRLARTVLARLPNLGQVIDRWMADDDFRRRAAGVRIGAAIPTLADAVLGLGLSDPIREVRLAGVAAVAASPGDVGLRHLVEVVTGDSSADVALAACHAMTGAPDPVRSRAAYGAIRHPDPRVRSAGLELLSPGGDEISAVLGLVSDPDPDVAATAARVLTTFPPVEAVATVWSSLRSSSPAATELFIGALAAIDARASERLAHHALLSSDPGERVLGVRVIVGLGRSAAPEALARALGDPATEVRVAAATALVTQPGSVPLDLLGQRTRDPSAEVRELAVKALSGLSDDRAMRYLLEAARDPAGQVRENARAALLDHPVGALSKLLTGALRDPMLRQVAGELLSSLPQRDADQILALVPEADDDTRAAAAALLGAPSSYESLIEGLGSADADRRIRSLQALALIGEPRSAPAVAARLEDPDPEIRRLACTTLGELGDPSVAPLLRRAMASDPDMRVVTAADTALRRLDSTPGLS